MQRRYQVFLSSTYEDLKQERLEVMRALLELECIPSGMEYFPAADDDQWSYISDLIDDCDYYVVILGGRYGSTDSAGKSFTQREYEYAVERGIPVIAFLHAAPETIPQGKAEGDPEARAKLDSFRDMCRKRLCKTWKNVDELGAVVSRSLTQLIRSRPRPGWVRASALASEEASQRIIELQRTVEEQKATLERLALTRPVGSEGLAQGADTFTLAVNLTLRPENREWQDRTKSVVSKSVTVSWDELFGAFAPNLLVPARGAQIRGDIAKALRDRVVASVAKKHVGNDVSSPKISDEDFNTMAHPAFRWVEPDGSKRDRGRGRRVERGWRRGSWRSCGSRALDC